MKKPFYISAISILYLALGLFGLAHANVGSACGTMAPGDLCIAIKTFASEAESLLKNRPSGDRGELRNSLERAWMPVEIIIRNRRGADECVDRANGLEIAAGEFMSWISRIDRMSENYDSQNGRTFDFESDLQQARARLMQYCPYQ